MYKEICNVRPATINFDVRSCVKWVLQGMVGKMSFFRIFISFFPKKLQSAFLYDPCFTWGVRTVLYDR